MHLDVLRNIQRTCSYQSKKNSLVWDWIINSESHFVPFVLVSRFYGLYLVKGGHPRLYGKFQA